MADSTPAMPWTAKLHMLAYTPLILLRATQYILVASVTPGPARPLKRTLVAALTRASGLTLGPLMATWAHTQPTTGDGVRAYCEKKGVELRSVTVPVPTTPASDGGDGNQGTTAESKPPDATLHFLTLPLSPQTQTQTQRNRTLVYFHGGGYSHPAVAVSHVPFAVRLATAAGASTLAILEYSLTPGVAYPGQLAQGIAAVRYVVGPGGDAAGDVVLAGDSAGGNLVAGVLAHVRCAGPFAEPLVLPQRLCAAVMVSPWVGSRFEGGSYVANARLDALDVDGMVAARDRWRPVTDHVWADMVHGKPPGGQDLDGFWQGVFCGEERVVDRAVVSVGGDEIFLDDVVAFAAMGGHKADGSADGSGLSLIRSPGETHCGAMLDAMIGLSKEGSMLSDVMAWLEKA